MSVDLDLVVEQSPDGKWIRERIPARVLGGEIYELANSPMLIQGLAADDRIRLLDGGHYELVERRGTVAVQVFGEWGEVDALAQHIASIGGRLCGKEPRMRVFSIPLSTGLHQIETTVDDVVAKWPKLSWMFGNVSTIDLLVDTDGSGEPMHEQVRVFDEGEGVFVLATSPLLASGVAAGDRVRVGDDGTSEVLVASGAVAIQTFGNWELELFVPKVKDLEGRLDGVAGEEVAVFTIESQDGNAPDIEAIETLFNEQAAASDDRAWRIANP